MPHTRSDAVPHSFPASIGHRGQRLPKSSKLCVEMAMPCPYTTTSAVVRVLLAPVSSTESMRASGSGVPLGSQLAGSLPDTPIDTPESGQSRAAARSGWAGQPPRVRLPAGGSLWCGDTHTDTTDTTQTGSFFVLQRNTLHVLCRTLGNCGVLSLGLGLLVHWDFRPSPPWSLPHIV